MSYFGFERAHLMRIIGDLSVQQGFEKIDVRALQYFVDKMFNLMCDIAATCHAIQDTSRRTQPLAKDVVLAVQIMNLEIDIPNLKDCIQCASDQSLMPVEEEETTTKESYLALYETIAHADKSSGAQGTSLNEKVSLPMSPRLAYWQVPKPPAYCFPMNQKHEVIEDTLVSGGNFEDPVTNPYIRFKLRTMGPENFMFLRIGEMFNHGEPTKIPVFRKYSYANFLMPEMLSKVPPDRFKKMVPFEERDVHCEASIDNCEQSSDSEIDETDVDDNSICNEINM